MQLKDRLNKIFNLPGVEVVFTHCQGSRGSANIRIWVKGDREILLRDVDNDGMLDWFGDRVYSYSHGRTPPGPGIVEDHYTVNIRVEGKEEWDLLREKVVEWIPTRLCSEFLSGL